MPIDNKEISRRVFEDVWNKKNFRAVDELMAPNYVHHDPSSPSLASGIEGYKRLATYYLDAFPDLPFTIDDQVAEGQTVASRWTATGTHTGDLPGIPRTGRRFSVSGVTVARVQNGKFVESWSNWDALGLMQQLGVVSLGGEAKGRVA